MNFTNLIKSPEAVVEATQDAFGAGIENAGTAEKVVFGLQVVLIGMGVVFGVLLLLIGILQIFKLFGKKSSTEKTTEQTVAAPAPAPVPASAAPDAAAPASEEEAIVAIATAAIAASRGESECAFNVISIKKIVK